MLYLEGMVIHNFKSFRHASIKFSKGFNCIVGPNGSGKSNIWDSLLFALGETSLRRLRVDRAEKLISAHAKSKAGVSKAYVKLFFNGDRKLEVLRAIKSNKKIAYKLDGKRATRQEVVDALRSYRCFADDTNTIAQGEIVYMEKLTPKQRRELIDSAAGIKEFDEKRASSLKELEKVDEKIREAQIELDLRRGFLSDIEKQKSDAESYIALKDYVTRGTYTILKARAEQVEHEYASGEAAIKAIEAKAEEITGRLLELESEESSLMKERTELTNRLNEKSIEATRISGKLNAVEKEIAIKESEVRSMQARMAERDAEMTSLLAERDAAAKTIKDSNDAIEKLTSELSTKSNEAGDRKLEKLLSSGKDAASEILAAYEKNQALINKLQAESVSLSSRSAQMGAESAQRARAMAELKMRISAKSADRDRLSSELEAAEKELKRISSEREKLSSMLPSTMSELESAAKRLGVLESDEFRIKEQIAMSGGATERRMTEVLKSEIKSGIYGRAYELCSYPDEYAAAVASAASSRLSYFVVESEVVAEKAIKLLKDRKMGRASFIPLNRIAASRPIDSSMDPLISHVEYDKKFERAFSFIFSDTYVLDSIQAASRAGIGKHRYVTVDGELVEQSGVITGGSQSGRVSIPALEAKLSAAMRERAELVRSRGALETQAAESKRKLAELVSVEHESEFVYRQKSDALKAAEAETKGAEAEMERLAESGKQAEAAFASLAAESKRIDGELDALKRENERVSVLAKAGRNDAERQKEIERYNSVRSEIEALKVSLAAKRKESELSSKRAAEIDARISSTRKQSKDDRAAASTIDAEVAGLKKSRSDLQDEYKSYGSKHGGIMSKLDQVNARMSKVTEERGRKSSEISKHERELAELKMKLSQQKIRISDIRADLAAYGGLEQITGEPLQEIESKVSSSKASMERLGTVNMKAPEIYVEKKREVEEAEVKMDVLQNEKGSVMSVIGEIDARKLSVFMQTFNEVNEKFKQLHGYVFDNTASLELDDKKDPLSSGMNIMVTGGRNRNVMTDQLSGGEKSLENLMLLFSIQMRNPMAFYLFDEVDTSLDKENTKKLSKLVGELSKRSQMIVVSHKDYMLSAAETTLGVVRRGDESQVVGISLESQTSTVGGA